MWKTVIDGGIESDLIDDVYELGLLVQEESLSLGISSVILALTEVSWRNLIQWNQLPIPELKAPHKPQALTYLKNKSYRRYPKSLSILNPVP